METDEIKKFPSLMKNEHVKEELQTVIDAEKKLKLEKAQLQWTINYIQNNCKHDWKEETGEVGEFKIKISRFKSKGNTNYSMAAIDSRICVLCGLHEETPAS